MPNLLEKFSFEPIINATGSVSRLGGAPMTDRKFNPWACPDNFVSRTLHIDLQVGDRVLNGEEQRDFAGGSPHEAEMFHVRPVDVVLQHS